MTDSELREIRDRYNLACRVVQVSTDTVPLDMAVSLMKDVARLLCEAERQKFVRESTAPPRWVLTR